MELYIIWVVLVGCSCMVSRGLEWGKRVDIIGVKLAVNTGGPT